MKMFGATLVLLTNCCYIANNYAVKWARLGAGEVGLVRGALQILVFSAVLGISKRVKTHHHRNNIESQKCKSSRKSKFNIQVKCVKGSTYLKVSLCFR